MEASVSAVNDRVRDASAFAYRLREEVGTVIVLWLVNWAADTLTDRAPKSLAR